MQKLNRPKKFKKKGFPVLFFLFLFLLESVIAVGAIGWYFFYTGKNRIALEEEKTRNYSITLAETFALTAEVDFHSHNYRSLRAVFRQKMQKNTIDEAFFVLLNGKLVVHSNPRVERDLKGYLSNDEFKYNLDYIHLYTKKRNRKAHFLDYYIDGTEAPFNKEEIFYIQKYFYKDITKYYWLVTRGVFVKGKPVGTVAFIISKNGISQYIREHIDNTIFLLQYALIGAFGLSFFISLIIFIRYRSLQKKALQFNATVAEKTPLKIKQQQPQQPVSQKPKTSPQSNRPDKQAGQKAKSAPAKTDKGQTTQKEAKSNLYFQGTDKSKTPDNDYITIEVLGTIDDREIEEMLAQERKRQAEAASDNQLTIFDEMPAKNHVDERNIKDAIPIRKD